MGTGGSGGGGAARANAGTSATAPESTKAPLTAAASGFQFDLLGCTRAGGPGPTLRGSLSPVEGPLIRWIGLGQTPGGGPQIQCALLVTNQNADRDVVLGDGARAIDTNGIEYFRSLVRLGNKEQTSIGPWVTMIQGVPMRAEVRSEERRVGKECRL